MTKPNDENGQKNPKPSNLQEKNSAVRSELAKEKKLFYVAVFLCQDCQLQVGGGHLQSLVTVDSNMVPLVHVCVTAQE